MTLPQRLGLALLMLAAFLTSGCQPTRLTADHRPEWRECKDTRDGEIFVVYTAEENIRNISIPLLAGDVCVDIIDTEHEWHHVCQSHEAWIKCRVIPRPPETLPDRTPPSAPQNLRVVP